MPEPKHLDFLDGFRGYSALYVLLLHCMMWGGWRPAILPDPKIAVDVFMIVSGYLMVYHWDSREYGSGVNSRTVKSFLVKRFFRIAPLYYLIIVFAYIVRTPYNQGVQLLALQSPRRPFLFNVPAAIHLFNPFNFLMHITFLFGVTTKYYWMLPDWSISLEMQFYVVFPFLLLAFRRIGYFWICAAALLLCFASVHLVPFFASTPSLVFTKLPIFFIGMLVAEAARVFKTDALNGAAIFFLAPLMAVLGFTIDPWLLVVVAGLLFFLTCGQDVPVVRTPLRYVSNVAGNRLAHFLADMSYSVYLIHYFFIAAFGWLLISFPALHSLRHYQIVALLVTFTILGAYGSSIVLHRYVEIPANYFGKKLSRRNAVKSSLALIEPGRT